jgi:ubiquinone/menaquinone biosynthesis C-methylase UbiE
MANSPGAVIHWAARYDLLMTVITLGRERRFRRRLLELGRVQPGESVLDVGCGTGSLAIEAKRAVGAARVFGIDASPAMIARARTKAAKARLEVSFDVALAQALPFGYSQFDVVLSSVMMHHLPKADRPGVMREAKRVLKPGGRLLVVDFGRSSSGQKGLLGRIHGHGGVDASRLVAFATEAGLNVLESGPVGTWDLQYVLAN